MKTVSQLLQGKGSSVWSVTPDSSVYDALKLMAEKNVGALLVMSDGKLRGILSERDYARKMVLHGKASRDTLVGEVMTSHVVSVTPAWSCDQCMSLMTERHVRHLPVVQDGRVVGVISIGDVVRAVLGEHKTTITTLEHYIMSGG